MEEKNVQTWQKKWMRILRICWPAVTGTLLLIFLWGNVLFSKTEGRIALLAIMIVLLAMSVRNYLLILEFRLRITYGVMFTKIYAGSIPV